MSPVVTICIPAWQSEAFIDKTLGYARSQTYAHLRILVSIDQSSDRTEEICRRHAREDARVEVVCQSSRQGWARNINSLLDMVASEYFFIYPHDDIIDATYVEKLLNRLAARPDAASVQCDVLYVLPDGRQGLNPGRAHEGPIARRVVASLVDPYVGEPLRSLIRTEAVGADLRFPQTSFRGFEAHQPFQTRLFAAGPMLHEPEILYWRWSSRSGGLVDSWAGVPIDALVADLRANASDCLELIDRCGASPSERTTMRFALYVNQLTRLRDAEAQRRAAGLVDPREVAGAFDFTGIPRAVDNLAPDVRRWLVSGYVNLVRKEAEYYVRRRNARRARARLRTVGGSDVLTAMPSLARRYAGRVTRRLVPLELPPDLRARLPQ